MDGSICVECTLQALMFRRMAMGISPTTQHVNITFGGIMTKLTRRIGASASVFLTTTVLAGFMAPNAYAANLLSGPSLGIPGNLGNSQANSCSINTQVQVEATTADNATLNTDVFRVTLERADGTEIDGDTREIGVGATETSQYGFSISIGATPPASRLFLAFYDFPDLTTPVARTEVTPAFLRTLPMSCLLYTSPSPRDQRGSRMPSSA